MHKSSLASFNNSWYNTGASKMKCFIWYFVNVLFFINPLNPLNNLKIVLLKLFGAQIGKGVIVKPGVNIKYPWKLSVGNNCWIGEKVWIDNLGNVCLKDNVCISQGALILSGNHNYKKTTFDLIVEDIMLESGVWIGANAVVCGGVVVQNHAVLSVGSVASNNLEPYSIYQGNPAKLIRKRNISHS